MRTSKFTPEQMVHILRQGDSGVPVVELCRQHGISQQTYYRWKKRFGDLGTAEVRELRQLRKRDHPPPHVRGRSNGQSASLPVIWRRLIAAER